MKDKSNTITVEKFLNVVHTPTTPVRIKVIMGDAWLTYDEAKRMKDFYLVENLGVGTYEENEKVSDRLLKYYRDAPLWNLTVWVERWIYKMEFGIEARCYYKDIREGYLAEKNDIQREKRRAYRKKSSSKR
jgi:hypothetical protein